MKNLIESGQLLSKITFSLPEGGKKKLYSYLKQDRREFHLAFL